MESETFDVAVIGAGGSGTMAYLRAVLNRNKAALFLGDADSKRKGRATWVAQVDNIPGMHDLKRPITSTTRSTLDWIQSEPDLGDGCRTIKAKVHSLEQDGEGFLLKWKDREGEHSMVAKFVVVATGIMDIQPKIGGSIEPILPFANRGDAIYCIRCDGHQTIGHKLSVIGDSDTQVYIAAMMMERYGHESMDLLTNGADPSYSEDARKLLGGYGMKLHTQPIVRVIGDAKQTGLEGFELEGGTVVETDRSIVSLGIIAYNDLLQSVKADLDAAGKALVSDKFESSCEGVFVVGDLVSGKKMQIYTGWDTAVDALDEIDRRLRMQRRRERLAN